MTDTTVAEVLVGGVWRASAGQESFVKTAPEDGAALAAYPLSPWEDVSGALEHGMAAYAELAQAGPEACARFLDAFADAIDQAAGELVALANAETALPAEPRLRDVELPRTTSQLRQAAAAARDRTWTLPTLSPEAGIASYLAPIPGVVAVFGPNNFPFAFNSAAGGDFAAAIATGHPVLAKANPGHPGTTRVFARLAREAAEATGLPPALVQLVYRTTHPDGARLVADPRVAATAYTGSQAGGLALKAAADQAGKPIYLEMSSINPVVVLPGALRERGEAIAKELAGSVLMGVGQFCTSPGLLLVPTGSPGDAFVRTVGEQLAGAPVGTLLDEGVRRGLEAARQRWQAAGARLVAEAPDPGPGACRYPNTVMTVDQGAFVAAPGELQAEAFGNMTLVVRAEGLAGLRAVIGALEGNLTGSVYSATDASDDEAYEAVAPALRERVGRLLGDKVPTGVAVVAAMNHGGPFPSTGHPHFTAIGIPASLRRFGTLQSFDAVRAHRLPPELQPGNPLGVQRFVGGEWTTAAVDWPVP